MKLTTYVSVNVTFHFTYISTFFVGNLTPLDLVPPIPLLKQPLPLTCFIPSLLSFYILTEIMHSVKNKAKEERLCLNLFTSCKC